MPPRRPSISRGAAPPQKEEGHRINNRIDAREVRLIDAAGENVGVVPIRQAIMMAEEASLDLVEISPDAKPPVCKILDYGKFKFQEQKKAAEARKKQKVIEIKEIKMRPMIDDHDYDVKMRAIRRFFEEGDKVKITLASKAARSSWCSHRAKRQRPAIFEVTMPGHVPGMFISDCWLPGGCPSGHRGEIGEADHEKGRDDAGEQQESFEHARLPSLGMVQPLRSTQIALTTGWHHRGARQPSTLAIPARLGLNPAVLAAWPVKGMPWRLYIALKGLSKMPKMKTKSSAKKRFKVTASGKIKAGAAGKRHGMIKRTNKQIRNQRGTMVLAPGDERLVKIHMPYLAK